jgi:hypothetical protein
MLDIAGREGRFAVLILDENQGELALHFGAGSTAWCRGREGGNVAAGSDPRWVQRTGDNRHFTP